MRKILLPVAAAALILSSVAATPAQADCAADIKKLEERMMTANESKPYFQNALGKIARAKDHLAKGKKGKCAKSVEKADKLLAKFGK